MGEPTIREALAAAMSQKLAQQEQEMRGVLPTQPQYEPGKQAQLVKIYSQYPFLAPALGDPQKLMGIIDQVHKRESRNSPGTSADLFQAEKAQAALQDLYGINAYTPKGFNQWSDAQKKWYDPRKEAGGVDTEALPE